MTNKGGSDFMLAIGGAAAIILWLTFWSAVVWVVWHFVSKYW
jgi:hypothetical protein